MAEKSIGALYGKDVREFMLPDSHYGDSKECAAPEVIVGVELEIENWNSRAKALPGWNYTIDGSLRNEGKEVISSPTKSKYLQGSLEKLFKHHQIVEGEDHYTERCSTHVHMNVQDFTWQELKVFCMVYQMVERLMFGFVGHDRKDSIFCVPWYESGITSRMIEKMSKSADYTMGNWVKYSALNLLPVRDKGTVEFRHLHGTCDVGTIMNWVNMIGKMNLYAKKVKVKDLQELVLAMNTVSNYDMFLGDVFGEFTNLLTTQTGYQESLSVGVVDTKLMLIKPKKDDPVEKKNLEAIENAETLDALLRAATRPGRRSGIRFTPPRNTSPAVHALRNEIERLENMQRNLLPVVRPDGTNDWSIAHRDNRLIIERITQCRAEIQMLLATEVEVEHPVQAVEQQREHF